MKTNRLQLKILSGMHKGAKLLLSPGEYVIGRGDGCDIILSDWAFATQHLRLTVNHGQAILTSLGQPALLAGEALCDEPNPVKPFQIISVGTTHFTLGPEGDWPLLRSPAAEDHDAGPIPDGAPDEEDADTAEGHEPVADQERRMPQLTRFIECAGFSRLRKFSRFSWQTYLALAIATLLTGELVVISQANTATVEQQFGQTPLKALLRQVLSELELSNLRVTENPNGTVKLSGRLATDAQKRTLDERLAPFGERVTRHLLVSEQLAESTKAIFRSLGLDHLDTRVGTNNALIVAGYVERQSRWDQALSTLRRDLPENTKIDDGDVDTKEERADKLRRLLADRDLETQLKVISTGTTLLVKGVLAEPERKRWRQAADVYKKRYGNLPSLTTQFNQPPREKISLPIKSVATGAVAFVVTEDGSKYLPGAKIAGYTVKRIMPDRLVLSRNNRETIYYFGDG